MGRTAAALLSHPRDVPLLDLPSPDDRGAVLLTGHLTGWEDAAIALVRSGRSVLAIAAPWHRSPRSASALAALRWTRGVRTVPRGPAGWRQAVLHVRSGGTLVVLIDSLSPQGRRALEFPGGPVGAPDTLVSFARRHRAWLLVARPDGEAWRAVTLPPSIPAERAAEDAVTVLRTSIEERPWIWAWVRALAVIPGLLWTCGCAPEPPGWSSTPLEAGAWVGNASDLRWLGTLPTLGPCEFRAASATLLWSGSGPEGTFADVHLDGGHVGIAARTAEGRWPDGPFHLSDVSYRLQDGARGESPDLEWTAGGQLRCGGCPLEAWAGDRGR